MTLQNKLKAIYETLAAVQGLKITHYTQSSNIALPYAVWEESGESSSLEADDHKAEQEISGYLYYFTQTEFDAMVDTLQDKLNSIDGLNWTYESVSFGDPMADNDNSIQHVWTWRLING